MLKAWWLCKRRGDHTKYIETMPKACKPYQRHRCPTKDILTMPRVKSSRGDPKFATRSPHTHHWPSSMSKRAKARLAWCYVFPFDLPCYESNQSCPTIVNSHALYYHINVLYHPVVYKSFYAVNRSSHFKDLFGEQARDDLNYIAIFFFPLKLISPFFLTKAIRFWFSLEREKEEELMMGDNGKENHCLCFGRFGLIRAKSKVWIKPWHCHSIKASAFSFHGNLSILFS